MASQPTLFDRPLPPPRVNVKTEAIERAHSNANDEWRQAAFECVVAVARELEQFTADAVWHKLNLRPERTHDPRAFGGVMTRAQREGIVAPTNMFLNSDRESQHFRPIRVWRSLLFRRESAA